MCHASSSRMSSKATGPRTRGLPAMEPRQSRFLNNRCENSSADAPTGTSPAGVPIFRPCPAFSVCVWTHPPTFPTTTASVVSIGVPRRNAESIPVLDRMTGAERLARVGKTGEGRRMPAVRLSLNNLTKPRKKPPGKPSPTVRAPALDPPPFSGFPRYPVAAGLVGSPAHKIVPRLNRCRPVGACRGALRSMIAPLGGTRRSLRRPVGAVRVERGPPHPAGGQAACGGPQAHVQAGPPPWPARGGCRMKGRAHVFRRCSGLSPVIAARAARYVG